MVISSNRKFLSPTQVQRRFGLSTTEYDKYVECGMPTYKCAGVTRHPIDEIYLWCESNRITLQDQNDLCTSNQIKKLLGINQRDLENWEMLGLPKQITQNPASGMKMFLYNKYDVIDWLKSQQNMVEV